MARRGPGAVGHGGIVPYGARSPARSAAEGHARIGQFKLFQWNEIALVKESP